MVNTIGFRIVFTHAAGIILLLSLNPHLMGQDSRGLRDCIVSMDIWVIGETCLIAGPSFRYGEYTAKWFVRDNETNLAKLSLNNLIFPLGIASIPKRFGWIDVETHIDFTIMDKIQKKVRDSYDPDDDSDYVSFYWLSSNEQKEQLDFLKSNYTVGKLNAELTYQYLNLGLLFRTPWRFIKTGAGFGVSYHRALFQFFYCVQTCDSRFAFFNAESLYLGPLSVLSVALYESENLTLVKYITEYKQKSKMELSGGSSYFASTENINITVIAWNFFF